MAEPILDPLAPAELEESDAVGIRPARARQRRSLGGFGAPTGSSAVAGFPTMAPSEPNTQEIENRNLGQRVAHEFVKSYGLRYDEQSDSWSLSFDNIAKSFEEDPFWTTLDYALLSIAPVKWGLALAKLGRGSKALEAAAAAGVKFEDVDDVSAVVKGYAQGTFRGKRASGVFGRAANVLVGPEKAKAAQMLTRAPAKPSNAPTRFGVIGRSASAVGRLFSNPIGDLADPEYRRLVETLGGDPAELRGLGKAYEKERRTFEAYTERHRDDILRLLGKETLDPDQQRAFTRFMEEGVMPNDPELLDALGKRGAKAFAATQELRLSIVEKGHKLGIFSDDARNWALKSYFPRIWADLDELHHGLDEMAAAGRPDPRVPLSPANQKAHARPPTGDGRDRLRKRTLGSFSPEEQDKLGRIFDPKVNVSELASVGSHIARQDWAQKLSGSVIAKSGEELFEHFGRLLSDGTAGAAGAAALRGVGPQVADALAAAKISSTGEVAEESIKAVAKAAGWKTMDGYFADLGRVVPDYLKGLPDELKGKYIDPTVVDDVIGTFRGPARMNGLERFYKTYMNWFRASKTAYNPATHMRNIFGAAIFHHLATGGAGVFRPGALESFRKFGDPTDHDWLDAIKSGVVGSSFDKEIRDAMAEVASKLGREHPSAATAVDMVFESLGKTAPKFLSKGAGVAERFYRNTDEFFKFDAFVQIKKSRWKQERAASNLGGGPRWEKWSDTPQAVRDRIVAEAMAEVNKYFPNYAMSSPLTDGLRNIVPFSSFTTEAVRVWKNAMVEKPHRAFFWTHQIQAMSQVSAGIMGISQKDLTELHEQFPDYNRGKLMLLLPMGDPNTGTPYFMDWSYLLPLGNLGGEFENATHETFFPVATLGINPMNNPAVSAASAAFMNIDPFSGREIQPRFTEEKLGIPVEGGEGVRRGVGLIEHVLATSVPPVVPPGYVGTNLISLAKGERHPVSGELKKPDTLRTIASDLGGIRMYEADLEQHLLNIKREDARNSRTLSRWWDRWEYASANGNIGMMTRAQANIIALRDNINDDGDEYFAANMSKHVPGTWAGLSRKRVEAVLSAPSIRQGRMTEQDRKMLAAMHALQLGRNSKRRSRGRRRGGRKGRSGK